MYVYILCYWLLTIRERIACLQVTVECIHSNLFDAVEATHGGQIDVLIFNPPYVPTDSEEIHGDGIEVSWAGGIDGREVIDRFLPKVPVRLESAATSLNVN